MLELTKGRIIAGHADICLRVPAAMADEVVRKICGFMALLDLPVRESGPEDSGVFTLEEVFPDLGPGDALRGLRLREGLTQKQLAERVGVHPSHISQMEKSRRPIGKQMARRLAKELRSNYKVFL